MALGKVNQFSPLALELALPWEVNEEQEADFKDILKKMLLLFGLVILFFALLPTIEKKLEKKEVITRATLILEPEPVPKIEPPKVKPVVKPKPKPKPKVQAKAKPKPKPKKEIATKTPKPKPVETVARKSKKPAPPAQVVKKESKAVSDLAAQFRQMKFTKIDTTKIQRKNVSRSSQGAVQRASRTVLGDSTLSKRSAGVEAKDLDSGRKSVALASHETIQLEGEFVGSGGSYTAGTGSEYSSGLSGIRSDESIRRVFEAGKSRAYMHYLKALKQNQGLAGTVMFEITIEPSGQISLIKVVSSELADSILEQKIMNTVKTLNFGAQDVAARRLTYKFNFLPT